MTSPYVVLGVYQRLIGKERSSQPLGLIVEDVMALFTNRSENRYWFPRDTWDVGEKMIAERSKGQKGLCR